MPCVWKESAQERIMFRLFDETKGVKMNRGILRRKILKGEILARVGHHYGYDDATYDVEFDSRRKFKPIKIWSDAQESHSKGKWDGTELNLTDWDLKTKSGWLSKEKQVAEGVEGWTLGIHSNSSFELVEKKAVEKLKKLGLY